MKLMTPEKMRQMDELAINTYKIPGILLMEHAAYGVFKALEEKTIKGKNLIVCGPGNNGGDGLALARQLVTWGQEEVKVIMMAPAHKLTADGQIYYEICQKLGVTLISFTETKQEEIFRFIQEADVIVDALFGTGLTRVVEGSYAQVIEAINQSKAYRVSIDIPSGIDGNSGKIKGTCIKADLTVSFAMPKIGLYCYPAIDYIGELKLVDIGIPKTITESMETSFYSIEKEEMSALLPERPTRSNKGTYGKVLVVGGQRGMSGAPSLTSQGAMRVGAGLVSVAVPSSLHDIMEQKLTEIMTVPLEDEAGHFGGQAALELEEKLPNYSLIAIGPGIGRSEAARQMVKKVLESEKPCVIDADGLYFVKEFLPLIKKRKAPVILTPHPGEMARISELPVEEILENPLEVAKEFAKTYRVILILKIERIVIGSPSGDIYINRGGNTGMAKGGSGDLLTGIIAGLWAQNIKPIEAAQLGVYIAARAADLMADKKSEYALLPTDVLEGIPGVCQELVKCK